MEGNDYEENYVERTTAVHNLLFCGHTLYVTYVPKSFYWFVPQCKVNNDCVLCTVKAKNRKKKHTTKKFAGFHCHSPLLNMSLLNLGLETASKVCTAGPSDCKTLLVIMTLLIQCSVPNK